MNSKFVKLDYDTSKERRCSVHGVMIIEGNFYKCTGKSRHGKITTVYRCILCSRGNRAEQYAKDPEASAKGVKRWRKKNPEKVRSSQSIM